MMAALLRAVLGSALIALPGAAALRGAPRSLSRTRSGSCALALTLGFAILVPVTFAAGLFGIALGIPAIGAISLLLAGGFAIGRARTDLPPTPALVPRAGAFVFSRFLLAAATILVVAKIVLVPVWSWDYYAVHGVRARRMFSGQHLRLDALRTPGLEITHPDYPPGIPIAWRLLTLGEPPDACSVKVAHLVFALALIALVREGVRGAGGSPAASDTAAAFAAISPLLWDTESLGLVEVPFALFLAAAFCLFLRTADGNRRPAGWRLGAVAGFLPWIKLREGTSLCAFLAIAIVLSGNSKRTRAIAASVLWAAAAIGVCSALLPPGERFLAGGWMSRGIGRLAHPKPIAALLAKELLAPEWLGFWIVFGAGWLYAAARGRKTAALLSTVIVAQLAAYASVYFVTYLNPGDHIRSSFYRIAAALLPAGILALAAITEEATGPDAWLAAPRPGRSGARAAERGDAGA